MSNYEDIIKKWQKNRLVKHPYIFHSKDVLKKTRTDIKKGSDKAQKLLSKLKETYDYLLNKDKEYIKDMVPDTTPGPCLFNLPPEHDNSVPHGMWKWDPKNPNVIVDEITGTKFPNDKYPEDGVLETTWGKSQKFTFYTGKSIEYNGFCVYASFSGLIRDKKTEYMIKAAYKLGLLYQLTEDFNYAKKTADILLRFADTYPYWLIHGMYGDIADMDPKVAASNPSSLPKGRTCLSPNASKKEIHVGYWGLGRGSSCGMEGTRVTLPAAVAYNLIADATDKNGKPLLSEKQKEHIEKDLLIESVTVFVNNPRLDNKSTGDRISAMAVGMVAGIEDYVKIGKDCFNDIVERWYLKDGSTSESPAYSMMVMHTMWILSEMLEGYKGVQGDQKPIHVYDRYKYHAIWKGMYDTLLQNLCFPASADSYPDSCLNETFCEILAYRFNKPEYWALLDNTNSKIDKNSKLSFEFLPPDVKRPENTKLVFRDKFFPALKQGYLRIGKNNNDGTLILNASDWGIHHHYDSLNLFYFYNGTEWLSDLGYLWDQPHKKMTVRTPAHQLVVLDEKEQKAKGRNGMLHHFVTNSDIKLVDASSDVYPEADTYRRACLLLQHSDDSHYIVDLFHTDGGKVKDYLIHGPNNEYETEGFDTEKSHKKLPYGLKDPVILTSKDDTGKLRWEDDNNGQFNIFLPQQENNEEYIMTTGFGQRGKTDMGAKLPYFLRRVKSKGPHTFITLLGASKSKPFVKSFKHWTNDTKKTCVIKVKLNNDTQDLIIYNFDTNLNTYKTPFGKLFYDGFTAVIRFKNKNPVKAYLYGGKSLRFNNYTWKTKRDKLKGKVLNSDKFGFSVDVPFEVASSWTGSTVYIQDEKIQTAYPVVKVTKNDNLSKIHTIDKNGEGFIFKGGKNWSIVNFTELGKDF